MKKKIVMAASMLALGLVGSSVAAVGAEAVQGGASNSFAGFYCKSAYNTSVKSGSVDTKDTLHDDCTVTDKAADGYGVYLQYNGYRSKLPDTGWKRLSDNAGGYKKVLRVSGTVSAYSLSGWQLRACRSIPNAADQCTASLFVPD